VERSGPDELFVEKRGKEDRQREGVDLEKNTNPEEGGREKRQHRTPWGRNVQNVGKSTSVKSRALPIEGPWTVEGVLANSRGKMAEVRSQLSGKKRTRKVLKILQGGGHGREERANGQTTGERLCRPFRVIGKRWVHEKGYLFKCVVSLTE